MKRSRKLIGAAAFSVALAGGGVAGAVLGAPGTSGAQDTTSTTAASTPAANPAAKHPGARRAVRALRVARRDGINAAAKVLGMTPEALRSELRSGKSIADVAKEKNVDVQKVIDAIVAEAKAKLEAEIGKVPDQVTKIVNHRGVPATPAN